MQNFVKTIINAVQSWTKKEIKNSVADWNQNDANAIDYVKNRTHWEEEVVKEVEYLPEATVEHTLDEGEGFYVFMGSFGTELVIGQKYTVVFNGEIFENLTCFDDEGYPTIGAPYGDFSEYHFCLWTNVDNDGQIWLNNATDLEGEHTISINTTTTKTVVHKLDSKYLDLPTNLATTDDVDEAYLVADEAKAMANLKMDANNPVGTGSFSMNRRAGTAVGQYSHAEGYRTTASGYSSHAEGYHTTASGYSSHAEGYYTVASNEYSHTEGYFTTAPGSYQHVQGKYNIKDVDSNNNALNTYAHIVGNGTSNTARSNAHTLDWNGVGWFQGGLQVGGNAQDDGAKNVLLEGDTINNIILKDTINGCEYIISMQNGNLVSSCKLDSIQISTMPTKTNYVDGEPFDSTNMVITAVYQDGTTRNVDNYIYDEFVLSDKDFTISYEEHGIVYTTTISNFTITPFDPAIHLIDFDYTENTDGTYTITGWKQTLNGEPSTEMIIPNNCHIVL